MFNNLAVAKRLEEIQMPPDMIQAKPQSDKQVFVIQFKKNDDFNGTVDGRSNVLLFKSYDDWTNYATFISLIEAEISFNKQCQRVGVRKGVITFRLVYPPKDGRPPKLSKPEDANVSSIRN